MTDHEFEVYLSGLTADQRESLRALRSLIGRHASGLEETVNAGRWLNGLVFYSFAGQMVYAIGPKGSTKTTFHMMPFYGSPELQERHGAVLAPFLTGKSCIAFRRLADLPVYALEDILRTGTPALRPRMSGDSV